MTRTKDSDGVTERRLAPWSVRACDLLVVFLGLWTLTCHAVVHFGGGLNLLLWVAGGVSFVAIVVGWLMRRRLAPESTDGGVDESARTAAESATARTPPRGLLIAGALVCVAPLAGLPAALSWWGCVAYFGAAVAWLAGQRVAAGEPTRSRAGELGLFGLALVAAFFTVTVHVHSPDDGYYLNMSVAAVDHPDEPLLARDTMHGVDAPIMHAVYRLHSYELLVSATAKLLGRTVMRAAHSYLPFVFGFFVALAFARLMRLLAPRRWLVATFVLLLLLAIVNETQQYHGRFAFARLQQGKSVFVSVLAPLLIAQAIAWMRRPSWRAWGLLAMGQVAAVGMTSTALWCAPAIAGLGLLAACSHPLRQARRLALGLLASAYPVVLGLAFRGGALEQLASESVEGVRLVRITADPITDGAELVGEVWRVVFGTGVVGAMALAGVMLAWFSVRTSLARRVLVAFPLGVLLFLLNPYLAFPVAEGVTGAITYWRVLWVLPVPVFLALLLSYPWEHARIAGRSVLAVAIAAGLWFAPVKHFTDPKNGVLIQPFALKIMIVPWRTSVLVRKLTKPGDNVLLSKGTSLWQAAFHRHPYPLVTRLNYLEALEPYLGPEEVDARRRLFDYVSGDSERDEAPLLRQAVRRYDLRVVSFRAENEFADPIRRVLGAAGFNPVMTVGLSEIWAR